MRVVVVHTQFGELCLKHSENTLIRICIPTAPFTAYNKFVVINKNIHATEVLKKKKNLENVIYDILVNIHNVSLVEYGQEYRPVYSINKKKTLIHLY